nr:LysR substrate-binding domain-containing protein [Pectobacterium sp. PL152]
MIWKNINVYHSLPRTGRIVPWRFRLEGKDVEMSLPGRTHCHGDVLGPVSLARQGAGITQTYFYVVERDLQEGSLKVVLKDYGGRRGLMSVMYPAHRYMPVRVRKFIDFLIEKLLLNKPFIKKKNQINEMIFLLWENSMSSIGERNVT